MLEPVLMTLDFARALPQKQGKVRCIPANFYEQRRVSSWTASAFREMSDPAEVTERFAQAIWLHQRLLRDQLTTLDGQSLRVLHPGFWNRESGPDFRGAVLQIGASPPRQGDVEIDLHPHLWKGHGHDRNPAFQSVILHGVWEAGNGGSAGMPTLPLKPFLDSPLSELKIWQGQNSLRELPFLLSGKCAAPLRDLPVAATEEILRQAAHVRLQAKASLTHARAQQAGWEQSLWEGLFAALGYKNNAWPMRRLAELAPACAATEGRSATPLVWQARLLGLSGLLPGQITGSKTPVDGYVRQLWDVWWREQEPHADVILPRVVWRFNGLRPANHPARRLALAAHWLASGDLPARLERWFARTVADKELLDSLLEVLQVRTDDFWSWHWTFRSARRAEPQPLLGFQRVTDLAMNVILPWFWVRAAAGKNTAFQELAERRYFAWPKGEDNAVLRLARQRLFGAERIRWISNAASQQGILQVVRDFCDHSNALCDQCPFPELVRELKNESESGD
jgi:hypothetical protein